MMQSEAIWSSFGKVAGQIEVGGMGPYEFASFFMSSVILQSIDV